VSTKSALVIGGGIAGLSTALAARRAGWHVRVFERAPALDGQGAGLMMWANGMQALDHLGLGDLAAGVEPLAPGAALRNRDGQVFMPVRTGPTPDGHPLMGGMSRDVLHAGLLAALGVEHVHTGHHLTGVTQDGYTATAIFENGEVAHGDILVGADGLHSAVRAYLYDDGLPEYAGYTSWRAALPYPRSELTEGESWGADAVFGQIALPHDHVYWYAAVPAVPDAPVGADARPELLARFGDWHRPIRDLIERTPPGAILRSDLCDRATLTRWTDRRMTLVGDAAHPMIPSLGQGANQALEDAVVLGRELHHCISPAAALANYEARRFRRACSFVERSRLAWTLARQHGSVAVRVRDTLARSVLPHAQARQLSWILATGF
jgi:2-polyprenyl-6-methoxyphenol hydroxylase-like FAD-dependent oxidoreductase